MNILIGDIGNTDIKLCLLNKNYKIIKKISFDKKFVNSVSFLRKKINFLVSTQNINKVSLFTSVVPSAFTKVKNMLKSSYNIKVVELKRINFEKIIKLKVNRKQIGSDRIANAIGSYYYYKSNCIVIDFGTATIFDVIEAGVYKGGIIAPGIKLSLNNLIKKAEQIPPLKIKKIKNVIGKNTVSAIRSGFFWGYIGLIDNIIELVKKETKSNFKIILTGGYSYLFKKSLKTKVVVDTDVTIKGLIKILKIKKGLY